MLLEGYVRLFRSINEWQWYDDPNTKSLFLHLIVNANYKPGYFKGIPIERGQILVGRIELSKILGISEQEVRTSIKRLKSTNDITTKSTNKGTLISVVNYEKYQVDVVIPTNSLTSDLTAEQPATNQQLTNNQPQRKKDNKDNKAINNSSNNTSAPSRITLPEIPIIELPLNDGTMHPVFQSQVDEYRRLYPSVDIVQELRNMLGWLNANQKNRKTASGINRFINGWLCREQNDAKVTTSKTYRRVEEIPKYNTNVQDMKEITEEDIKRNMEMMRQLQQGGTKK